MWRTLMVFNRKQPCVSFRVTYRHQNDGRKATVGVFRRNVQMEPSNHSLDHKITMSMLSFGRTWQAFLMFLWSVPSFLYTLFPFFNWRGICFDPTGQLVCSAQEFWDGQFYKGEFETNSSTFIFALVSSKKYFGAQLGTLVNTVKKAKLGNMCHLFFQKCLKV